MIEVRIVLYNIEFASLENNHLSFAKFYMIIEIAKLSHSKLNYYLHKF